MCQKEEIMWLINLVIFEMRSSSLYQVIFAHDGYNCHLFKEIPDLMTVVSAPRYSKPVQKSRLIQYVLEIRQKWPLG